MFIRKANKKDARRISYLIRKNTEKVLDNKYTQAQMSIWKKANTPKAIEQQMNTRQLFCAFENNKLVGTIGLQENEVVGLYVSYTQRKAGIGKKLLQHLEQYARKKGIGQLTLTSTRSARRFYESNDYIPIKSVVVNIQGVEFLETVMRKTLY